MAIPMKGMFVNGIWWSWHFRLQQARLEQQLGERADDILSTLMAEVIAKRPEGLSGQDYVVALVLDRTYDEHRNWVPPNTIAIVVRLEYVRDLGRHAWKAKTLLFTRESQCASDRGCAQSTEDHFRVGRVSCQYAS